MSLRSSLVSLLLVAATAGAGYLAYRRFVLPPHGCEVCGRGLHPGMESTVQLENGRDIHTCCPRCALHSEQTGAAKGAVVTVEDYDTAERVPAAVALYIEGSDVEGCAMSGETAPREPGVPYERTFDRCLPTLSAFKSESRARAFQERHGGRLLTYSQARESVRKR
jgi:hypothetical protein